MQIIFETIALQANFKISANGVKLIEHATHKLENVSCNIAECVVEVHEGDKITISGEVTGPFFQTAVDYIVDGSLVWTSKSFEKSTGQNRVHQTRLDKVTSKINDSGERTEQWHRGRLRVTELDGEEGCDALLLETTDGHRPGVGCMVVVIYAAMTEGTSHHNPAYSDSGLGAWAKRQVDTHASKIAPTHQAELCDPEDWDIHHPRAHVSREMRRSPRPGSAPLAEIWFYYRSASAVASWKKVARVPEQETRLEAPTQIEISGSEN